VVLTCQILRRRLGSFAVSSCQDHYRVLFRNIGLDCDEAIIFDQPAGLSVEFGAVFPLLSWKRIVVYDGSAGAAAEVFLDEVFSRPFVDPHASQEDHIMILHVFGAHRAALFQHGVFAKPFKKRGEPIQPDSFTDACIFVIRQHQS
jgi:hypothetical protein